MTQNGGYFTIYDSPRHIVLNNFTQGDKHEGGGGCLSRKAARFALLCAAVGAWFPCGGCCGRQSRGSGPVFLLKEPFTIYNLLRSVVCHIYISVLLPLPRPVRIQAPEDIIPSPLLPSPLRESGSGGFSCCCSTFPRSTPLHFCFVTLFVCINMLCLSVFL